MKVIGDVLVTLPFTLDFCAKGPDVEPLYLVRNHIEVTLFFPPSMSEGTVGQSFFPSGWAWWTGDRLRLVLTYTLPVDSQDLESIRSMLLLTTNDVLRRFLNAYRRNFQKANVYPVKIDPKALLLELEHDDGTLEKLPEPVDAMFFNNIPETEPLLASVNGTTIDDLLQAMYGEHIPRVAEQLALDVEWLRDRGEQERADRVNTLLPANGASADAA